MQPIASPAFLPLPAAGFQKPDAAARENQLKQAVDDFASILFSQMFREMREAGKDEDEGSVFGGGDTNLFMHLMDQELGDSYARAGGNPLREAMLRQLNKPTDPALTGRQGGSL
ncbi:MAG: rod-binding protein [Candidatus Sericytochromatia bacterium]|nr:rod-binding protein [Candidatus Sericytochromatia bacterium]